MRHEAKPFHDGSETIWSEKPSRLTPFHVADGVSIYLAETEENPDDDFLGPQVTGAPNFLSTSDTPAKAVTDD